MDRKDGPSGYELFPIVELDGRSFVQLSQVVRLIADGACSWVFFENGKKIITTKNLGYYEKILPRPDGTLNNKFFRVHHKHLVNLSYMRKYNKREQVIYLNTNDIIPISQRKSKEFKDLLRSLSLY